MPTTVSKPSALAKEGQFAYEQFPLSIQKAVREQTESIHSLLARTSANIVQIGLRLEFVRARIGREHFQPWLRREFEWSQPTASNYMRAARVFSDADCLDFFMPSALFVLARRNVTASARAEAIRLARRGELITKVRAVTIVAKHRSRRASNRPAAERVRRYFLNAVKALSADEVESLAAELSEFAERLRENVVTTCEIGRPPFEA